MAEGLLLFHGVHGFNAVLSQGSKTATRKDLNDNGNGILFTCRPLNQGETFEVQQLQTSSVMQGGGIELGVTDNDPVKLQDDLPKTMTDMRRGNTIMVSGRRICLNGKDIDFLNHSISEVTSKDRLGLRLDGGGSVEILMNGEVMTRADVSNWKNVYGVTELYGRAEKITITSVAMTIRSSNSVDEVKKSIKELVIMMARKDKEELKKVLVTVQLIDTAYHKFLRTRDQKQNAASYFARLQGGHILALYLDFLNKIGLTDKLRTTLYNDTRSVCWNYCDNSHDLCMQLGKGGLLDLCTSELASHKDTYRSAEATVMIVYTAFGIIHNCAKVPENCVILRACNFVEVAKPYTDTTSNATEIVLNAVISISHVMEENEASIARINQTTMEMVLSRLKKAIEAETHQHDGWHAYELCLGLANLSADFQNLKNAVELGAHGLFARLLLRAFDDQEKLAALKALDALVCSESARTISDQKDMLTLLDLSVEKGSSAVKDLASKIKERLKKLVKEREEKAGPKKEEPKKVVHHQQVLKDFNSTMQFGGAHAKLPVTPTTVCKYRELCTLFKTTLNLDDAYFNPAFDMCYCKECHKERKDNNYYRRGSPPKEYGLPIGWCRFSLLLPPRAKALDVSKKWHRAFHGTKQEYLSRILEVGELAVPGRDVLGGKKIREREGHFCDDYKPDGFDTKKIFLSPSIHYAGCDAYASPQRFRKDSTTYGARVAFQVFISPDAYDIGPETVGARSQFDPKFSNKEIEWFTSQQGSTILYGLLVKVDELKRR